nr:hypothetical protein [Novosphingobium sp. HII-3]
MPIQICDRGTVDSLIVGRESHNRPLWQTGQFLFQSLFFTLQILKARHDGAGQVIFLLHLLHQLGDPAPGLGKACLHFIATTMSHPHLVVQFPLQMHSEPADDFRGEQFITQACKCPVFQMCAGDRTVFAGLARCGLAAPTGADADERLSA